MIAFITSLPHPWNCRSYERIGSLLGRTLSSVLRQTHEEFVVLVVCNQRVAVPCADSRIHFIEVGFPPINPVPGTVGIEHCLLDKGIKYAVGLLHAKAFHPDHVMFFDADDLVSRDIASFANERPDADGWFIDQGYVWWEGSARVTMVRGFNKVCGTSNIVAFRLLDLSDRLPTDASKEVILETLGDFHIRKILGSHSVIARHFNEKGAALEPLPFPGAIWIRGTGENSWTPRGFPSLAGRKLTPEIREGFNLQAPFHSLLADAMASFRQTLPVWTEARRSSGLRAAAIDTFWKGPRRMLSVLRGNAWRL